VALFDKFVLMVIHDAAIFLMYQSRSRSISGTMPELTYKHVLQSESGGRIAKLFVNRR
jgi:hypothetical protein